MGRRDGTALRQRHSLQNFSDQQMGLNGGQILAHGLSIDPQTKQSRGISWGLSLDQNCGWYAHAGSLCHVQAPVTFSRRERHPHSAESEVRRLDILFPDDRRRSLSPGGLRSGRFGQPRSEQHSSLNRSLTKRWARSLDIASLHVFQAIAGLLRGAKQAAPGLLNEKVLSVPDAINPVATMD
jgi:hypothetical protein